MDLKEIQQALQKTSGGQQNEAVICAMTLSADRLWVPNPGPQSDAYFCEADELFYGGQAGGGKTALLLGLATTEHQRSLILRRTNTEAVDLADDLFDITGSREGWNGKDSVMRLQYFKEGEEIHRERLIKIGGCQHEDDKQKFKGRPRDFYGIDEVTDFSETQYIFITGWNRSTDPDQRCRVVATGNPPTTPEGLWVIKRWAAWLDETHPNPAKPGELRWYTTGENDEEIEVDGPGPHMINGEEVIARSRTFIPAELSDNPDLAETNYKSVLSGLPKELRDAYRDGKFNASLKDKPFQVLPTAWVKAAQKRWTPDGFHEMAMTSMGFDPADGGDDAAELAIRYGGWYAPMVTTKGKVTADGSLLAAIVITHRKDNCPVVVDMGGGYGGKVTQRLKDNNMPYIEFNGSKAAPGITKEGKLKFYNQRAKAAWRFREALDPDQEGGSVIALPPDPEIVSDLCSLTWFLTNRGIRLHPKKDIKKLIGRSPGKGDAIIMALDAGNAAIKRHLSGLGRQPVVVRGRAAQKR